MGWCNHCRQDRLLLHHHYHQHRGFHLLQQVINCPDSFQDLLQRCMEIGDGISNPILFSHTGDIISSIEVVRDNDILYIGNEGDTFQGDNLKAKNRAEEFKLFSEKKKDEREQFFKKTNKDAKLRPKKEKEAKEKTCKLCIGMMVWSSYQRKRKSKPRLVCKKQVGKQMNACVHVQVNATASIIIDKAVAGFKLLDQSLDTEEEYILLYPDCSIVDKLPQSQEVFTPKKYVELLGTFYSKVKLYLILKKDWISYRSYSTIYDPLDSDSDGSAPKQSRGDSDLDDEEVYIHLENVAF
ncbi:hypothetical protein AC249_AIPGENE10704 [Exaiptasia diaphana]|nr:hypothetical protein AC249_AIPGENE10704 [Exaiptasia diaphana]